MEQKCINNWNENERETVDIGHVSLDEACLPESSADRMASLAS